MVNSSRQGKIKLKWKMRSRPLPIALIPLINKIKMKGFIKRQMLGDYQWALNALLFAALAVFGFALCIVLLLVAF